MRTNKIIKPQEHYPYIQEKCSEGYKQREIMEMFNDEFSLDVKYSTMREHIRKAREWSSSEDDKMGATRVSMEFQNKHHKGFVEGNLIRERESSIDVQASDDGPITYDDLVERFNIDENVWIPRSFKPKTWDVAAKKDIKDEEGNVVDTELITKRLHGAGASFDPDPAYIYREKIKKDLMEEMKQHAPKFKTIKYPKLESQDIAWIINIFDAHIEKLAWMKGDDHTIEVSEKKFMDGLVGIMGIMQAHKPSQIIFPVGNDFFNADNSKSTTTRGTPQSNMVSWREAYRRGRKIIFDAIQLLSEKAPVHVPIVPGNHDEERSFYLGDSLEVFFDKNENVTIDNGDNYRKYYKWGKGGLLFTHGDKEKPKDLPLIMMRENQKERADVEYMEGFLGHLHKKEKYQTKTMDEDVGITIRRLGSPSEDDQRHHNQGYVGGHKQMHGAVWHKEMGPIIGEANYIFDK